MTATVHKDGLRRTSIMSADADVVEIKLNGEEFTEKMLSGRGLDSKASPRFGPKKIDWNPFKTIRIVFSTDHITDLTVYPMTIYP